MAQRPPYAGARDPREPSERGEVARGDGAHWQALARLNQLLEEEREALRALDAPRVAALADEKRVLFDQVLAARPSLDASFAAALRPVVSGLRRNCILLAHARDVVRSVVEHESKRRPRLSLRG
jgi:hypothetical protein